MAMDRRSGRLVIDNEESLLFTGEVHYWRLEVRAWRPVLQALLDTGMTWVGTYVPWRVHDLGVHDYDFTGRTDERLNLPAFLDLCAEMGLMVYFRPGPLIVSEMACGGYPDWLGHSGPEYMVWTAQGEVPMGFPGEGNPGRCPSYLHPKYLDHCRRYLEEVNKVIAPYLHQNGGPIKLYQLDNEVSLICRDAMFQSDYNPCIVGPGGEYHQWLTAKYGSVEKVPYACEAESIEAIDPPRNLDRWGEMPESWYFDWAEFKEWILAEYVRRIKQIHLDCGVDDVMFCTNFNPHRPNSMPNNWVEQEKACAEKNPGLVGYDYYRGPFLSRTGYASMDRIGRALSSLFEVPWSAEFMCGFWNEDYNEKPYPYAEHHEFMADVALASGLKAISWYMFHDREHWGGSPVSALGHRRYAHKALTDIMDFVGGAHDFGSLAEPREVGVVCYRPYLRHTFIGDPSPAGTKEVNLGKPVIDDVPAGRIGREYEGLFGVLADAGYHPGVVDPWVNPGDLPRYGVVFCPTATFMAEADQAVLLDYVKQGGTLVMGPSVPVRDVDGQAAAGFAKLLSSNKIAELARGTRLTTGAGSAAVEGELYAVSGDPAVVSADGRTLFAETRLGEGRIVMAATYCAQVDDPAELADNHLLVRQLLERFGVTPYATTDSREVKAVLLAGDSETYLYLLNHGIHARRVTVRLRDVSGGALADLRSEESIDLVDGVASVDVDVKRARLFKVC